jgi:hypothetical protein
MTYRSERPRYARMAEPSGATVSLPLPAEQNGLLTLRQNAGIKGSR